MRSRDSAAEHYTDIQLAIPGRVIHLKRPNEAALEGLPGFQSNESADGFCNRFVTKKPVYIPCECTLEHFRDIEVDLDMGADHFPDNYCLSLENILEDWKSKHPVNTTAQ